MGSDKQAATADERGKGHMRITPAYLQDSTKDISCAGNAHGCGASKVLGHLRSIEPLKCVMYGLSHQMARRAQCEKHDIGSTEVRPT